MYSFTLHAVGNLTRDPESVTKGHKSFTRFTLSGNDYVGREGDIQAREVATNVSFTAFGAIGDVIARNARKGDQLIVEARLSTHADKDSGRIEHTFIVEGFRFGAPGRSRRESLTADAEAGAPAAAQT